MTQSINSSKNYVRPGPHILRKESVPVEKKEYSKTELEKKELLKNKVTIKDEIVIQDRKWVATEIWLG